MKIDLNNLALYVHKICVENQIVISIDWIPRQENTRADRLSKMQDFDDWSINNDIFAYFDNIYGPFTLDVFANDMNTKCSKFYAKWWCQGCAGVDAFAYNWGTDLCWVAPPPYLIAKVLIHAESNKAKGICFIPKWEAAIFWPIVIKLINNKKITLIHEFVRPCKLFIKGSLLNKIFTEETCSFNMLVFKFRLIFFTLLILIT